MSAAVIVLAVGHMLWVASFLLPAVDKGRPVYGYKCAVFSFARFGRGLGKAVKGNFASIDLEWFAIGAQFMANILLICALGCLMLSRVRCFAIAACVLYLLAFSFSWAPSGIEGLIGYYVWQAAFGICSLGAILQARRRGANQDLVQSS